MENNPLKNAELSQEQNANQIDGLLNNLPAPPPLPVLPVPAVETDKVKEPPRRSRSREREER
ncbi:DUF4316 domain-containing protein [Eubacterium limosum]|uniref:DUF4316 domain-containing protein n=1 Tax=Eubacterium limosum TaxID=1736 RepID=UPI001062D414|nr:DUF4316 domain-containing protein [Eubacterium limosum]